MKNSLKHEDVSDQRMRELFASNPHLMDSCDVQDTFVDYPITYDDSGGCRVTRIQIIEYLIGGTRTPRALIYRTTFDDGSAPVDTVRMFRVDETIYHLMVN